jgi:transcriptional regulator with XRE-family HTH domain
MNKSNKLKTMRLENQCSIRELSEITGISASTISRIERGMLHPTVPVARKLSTAFGITMDELFSDDPTTV